MRIFHIGPPKTGTSSLQFLLKSHPKYIGVYHPRNQKQQQIFQEVYNFLLYRGPQPESKYWPDSFIISEEAFGWNHRTGAVADRMALLQKVFRPQDRILITTRNPRKVLFSWYCERYDDFYPRSFSEVLNHASFDSYDYSSFDHWIPPALKHQVVWVPMEELANDNFERVEHLLNIHPPFPTINNRPKKNVDNRVKISLTKKPFNAICNFGDIIYARHINSSNKKRFSKSRLNPSFYQTKYLSPPSKCELDTIINQRFLRGMTWLEEEHGIHYS